MSDRQIKGVYYESKRIEAGTMGTKRVHEQAHDIHYFCQSNNQGEVVLYYLKPGGRPTSIAMDTISREQFDSRFRDCSTHRCDMKPKTEEEMKKEATEQKVIQGEKHMERKEYHAAAFEFGQAVKQDKKNLRAHLGKGKAHLSLGEVDQARESFEKLSEIDDLYGEENKHIFNEYGIELRRGALYDLAIENYSKAIAIDARDEALYFNIARAYSESGRNGEAVKNLEKALSLKPDFNEAKMLRAAITKQALKK